VQSPEYPDLEFVTPRAWGSGRPAGFPKLIVVHYTAGSETRTSAEDGAGYDSRRTDGTSCHFFHDQNSTVQCVRTTDRANSAFWHGNRIGIQHELCGTLQTRAQWLDAASYGTLQRAARQIARDCLRWKIPARRLTVAETRAAYYSGGAGGICGHNEITYAFPEDNGNHTDPGPQFPWDVLIGLVREWITVLTPAPPAPLDQNEDEGDMSFTHIIPVSGVDSFGIPGAESDPVDGKRETYLNIFNAVSGAGKYRLRLAGWTLSGPYALGNTRPLGGKPDDDKWDIEQGHGQMYSIKLLPGTVAIECTRTPHAGSEGAYQGSLSYVVIRGRRTV
jgi:N-acetyl-anhydromuramyl-L-alanine amidase AmpD